MKQFYSEYFSRTNVKYHFVFVHPDAAALEETAMAMSQGKIKAVIENSFPLKDAAQAHAVLEAGHVTGKLVLIINQDLLYNDDKEVLLARQI